MRHVVAAVIVAPALAGCSLIYNPGNLPAPGVDAEVILDADPSMLELTSASPAVIEEGRGVDGSRRAVVVVEGKHLVPGARISLTVHGTTTPYGMVDDAMTDVAANGHMVAAPVVFPVDEAVDTGFTRLDVTVTQPVVGGTVSRTLTGLDGDAPVLRVQHLDELTDTMIAAGTYTFSRVAIAAGGLAVTTTTEPLVIRSASSIKIQGIVQVSSFGPDPGPGGNAGGAGGPLLTAGQPGAGPAGGKPSGAGGGFATEGSPAGSGTAGDAQITTLAPPNRSSGGSGGAGPTLGTTTGGPGGGGGGSVELTAGGDITITKIEANGGPGGNGANPGGGGSGGLVLLRSSAGTTAVAMGISAIGGTGGGMGGAGRVRTDLPAGTVTSTPVAYRGPMFAPDTPLITRESRPAISVTGQPNKTFAYYFDDLTGANRRGPFTQTLSGSGQNTLDLDDELFRGVNTVCLIVEGVDIEVAANRPEARNCVQLVYLYTP